MKTFTENHKTTVKETVTLSPSLQGIDLDSSSLRIFLRNGRIKTPLYINMEVRQRKPEH